MCAVGLLFERDGDAEVPCEAASHSCYIAFALFPNNFP